MIKVAPSILSADLANLARDVEEIRAACADYVHFDVMDGAFVPNISMGVPVLASLRKATDMFLDAHLMVDRPVRYVEQFCKAGADLVNVHVEADTAENISAALEKIRACGKKTGVTLKPGTPAEAVLPWLELSLAFKLVWLVAEAVCQSNFSLAARSPSIISSQSSMAVPRSPLAITISSQCGISSLSLSIPSRFSIFASRRTSLQPDRSSASRTSIRSSLLRTKGCITAVTPYSLALFI